jgi:predicted transposase/invertase (TIGR01784 family)
LDILKLPEKDRKEYEKHIDELRFRASVLQTEEIKLKYAEEKGKKEGLKEGMEKGMEKRNKEIAIKMKELGVDIKIISETTGLSEKKIKNL